MVAHPSQLHRLPDSLSDQAAVLLEPLACAVHAAGRGRVGNDGTVVVQGISYTVGGDIIVAINGTKIVNTDSLSSYLQEYALPGEVLVVQIIRDGTPMTVNLTLGVRPPPPSG